MDETIASSGYDGKRKSSAKDSLAKRLKYAGPSELGDNYSQVADPNPSGAIGRLIASAKANPDLFMAVCVIRTKLDNPYPRPLCTVCQQSLSIILSWNREHKGEKARKSGISTFQISHQKSLRELILAGEKGCSLCAFLHQEPSTETRYGEVPFSMGMRLSWEANTHLLRKSGSATGISDFIHFFPESIRFVCLTLWEQLSGPVSPLFLRPVAKHPPIDLAVQWIADCSSSHERCQRLSHPPLPPRLIDLGGAGAQSIRLVETFDMQCTAYVTLSHCWGSGPSFFVTTTANKESMLCKIPYDDLAQNFRDAIEVTRACGIRYLWIDSLCIVQDDREDWESQCQLMGSIYANSTFTIVAASASRPHDGFLHERPHEQAASVLISRSSSLADAQDTTLIRISEISPELYPEQLHTTWNTRRITSPELKSGPYTRAWCFQERLLPCRVLTFARDRIYFECLTCEYHEKIRGPIAFGVAGIRDRVQFHIPDDHESIVSGQLMSIKYNFYDLVMKYSQRALSRTSDRLTAFSGIARHHHEMTGDEYLAGLWRSQIIQYLCWEQNQKCIPITDCSLRDVSAPSWSWASCPGEVKWSDTMSTFREDILASLVSANVEPAAEDAFGQVKSGTLVIEGHVKICTIETVATDRASFSFSFTDSIGSQVKFRDTVELERPNKHKTATLLLMKSRSYFKKMLGWCVLVLRPSADSPGAYERLGIFWDESVQRDYKTKEEQNPPLEDVLKALQAEPKREISIV